MYHQQTAPSRPPILQHPVPQHPPVQVPSPTTTPSPPAQPPARGGGRPLHYGPAPTHHPLQPQQQQQQQPNYNQFFNQNNYESAAAAQLGMQFGRSAVMAGSDYVEKNIHRYVNLPVLKHHFNVSNLYVLQKIKLLLWPWRNKSWARLVTRSETDGHPNGFRTPREDVNSPDLYIPAMAFVTYIVLIGIDVGRQSKFHPEVLGLTASTATILIFFEVMFMKLCCYLLSVTTEIQWLDLIAYCGYKFVGAIFTLFVKFLVSGWAMYAAWIYTSLAMGFFLLRSLRHVMLSEGATIPGTGITPARKRRVQLLFLVAALQIVFMWVLVK